MNPEDNQQTVLSSNYLDQIAPTNIGSKSPFFLSKPALFGLGAALILAIVIIAFGAMPSSTKSVQKLSAKLSATQAIVDDGTSKVRNNTLLGYNSELKIYLTSITTGLSPILSRLGIKKIDANIQKEESSTNALAKLEDARLNGNYDRFFSIEMNYRISSILSLMKSLYDSTTDKELKKVLEEAYANFESIQDRFESYGASNS